MKLTNTTFNCKEIIAFNSLRLVYPPTPVHMNAKSPNLFLVATANQKMRSERSLRYENLFQKTMLVKKTGFLTKNERSLVEGITSQKS